MPDNTPKIKSYVTGIDGSVIEEISKAQSKAMKDFSGELEKIASSLSILEEKIPKSIVEAMKNFTDEFLKTTATQQTKSQVAEGLSGAASASTAQDPTGDRDFGAPPPKIAEAGPSAPPQSVFKSGEGPIESVKKLQQYGPGSGAGQVYGGMSDEAIEAAGTVLGADTEGLKSARREVARFSQTPRTALGKAVTALESVAGGMPEGGITSKFLDKTLGPKREETAGAGTTSESTASSRRTGSEATQQAQTAAGGGGGRQGGGGGGRVSTGGVPDDFEPPERGRFAPRFEEGTQKFIGQDYAKQASDMLKKAAYHVEGRGPELEGVGGARRGDLYSRGMLAGSSILDTVSTDIMPAAQMGMQAYRGTKLSKAIGSGFRDFGRTNVALGTQQGIDPGTGDLELGGFGARLNSVFFNEAAQKGAKMKLQALRDARAAGIDAEQSMAITQAVSGLGYKEGTQQFSYLKSALNQVQQQYGQVTPEDVQMGDLMTRYSNKTRAGAARDFHKFQKETFEASKTLPLTQEDMKTDAMEMAQHYRSVGGTALQGVKTARAVQDATGMQARELKPIMQSGFYQGNLALSTGLLPYEAGLATPAESMSAMRKTIKDMRNAAPDLGDTSYVNKFGQTVVHTAEARKRAFISNALGGEIAPEKIATVEKALDKNIAAEEVLTGIGLKGTLNQKVTGPDGKETTVWSNMRSSLKGKYTEAQIKEIEKAGKSDQGIGGTAQAEEKMAAKIREFQQADTKKLRDEGIDVPGLPGAGKGEKGGKSGQEATVGNVTITLEGDAAKLFKIKSEENKTKSDGGGKSTAQAFLDDPVGSAGDMISKLF